MKIRNLSGWKNSKRKTSSSIMSIAKSWRRSQWSGFRRMEGSVGEDLYAVYGQTEAGRYLIVFFIEKSMALRSSSRHEI